jgi:hypothetical protein
MDPRLLLPLWVVVSITLSAFATSWLYRGDGARAEALNSSGFGQLLLELGSLMFHLAVPFIALLTGAISLDLMGLGKLWVTGDHTLGFTTGEWLRAIGESIGAAAVALLSLWISRRGAGYVPPEDAGLGAALTAVRDEAHWMFYRAPGTLLFGDPLYGALIGFAAMLFEWLLHPRFLTAQISRDNRWHLLVRLICALVSGALYLGTRNLWLMVAAAIVIRVAAAAMQTERRDRVAAA